MLPTNLKGKLQELPEHKLDIWLLAAILSIFVLLNKTAFLSYFSDDDLQNLALARFVPWLVLPKTALGLGFEPNVRPVGILFYKILGVVSRFNFAPYVAVLQVFHLGTSFLLWLFLKRLGIRPIQAGLGCLFFALHMSTLPAYWKPMYVFDVLCGFWMVASLLLYQRNRFFLSLLCAWLAFRSKEMELMLPVVLCLYELCFGDRPFRWKPLIPFFLMSLSFGLQAVMATADQPETGYSPHLTAQGLWLGLQFYGQKLLYAPLSGLTISIGLLFLRSRVITFGVLGFWILLCPMLLFPARQAGAYLYVPLLAFAAAIAGLAEWNPWWAALLFAIWIPASYEQMRIERNPVLSFRHEHRPYVTQILDSLAKRPAPKAVLYDGSPLDFNVWGQQGLFRYALDQYDLPVYHARQPEGVELSHQPGTLIVTWDRTRGQLLSDVTPQKREPPGFLDFSKSNPVWLLNEGWFGVDSGCRWTAPHAKLSLWQPAGASTLAIVVNVPVEAGRLHQSLRVKAGDAVVGEYRLEKSGRQTVSWPVSATGEMVKAFDLEVTPPYKLPDQPEPVGVQVCTCGFVNAPAGYRP